MASNLYLFTDLSAHYLLNSNYFISNVYTPIFEIRYIWWHVSMAGNFCYFSLLHTNYNIIGRIWIFPSFIYFNPFFIKTHYFLAHYWYIILTGGNISMDYSAYQWFNFHDDDLIVVLTILDGWKVNLY
jgi:hypothetical protein